MTYGFPQNLSVKYIMAFFSSINSAAPKGETAAQIPLVPPAALLNPTTTTTTTTATTSNPSELSELERVQLFNSVCARVLRRESAISQGQIYMPRTGIPVPMMSAEEWKV